MKRDLVVNMDDEVYLVGSNSEEIAYLALLEISEKLRMSSIIFEKEFLDVFRKTVTKIIDDALKSGVSGGVVAKINVHNSKALVMRFLSLAGRDEDVVLRTSLTSISVA